ncbi:putative disease resistance protein RGA3 isoform X2 [Arachis stenosperma]|uniref:putative disease resistance protein RGA3 isoform X2 n=1 Tax=Arachis stenosperma TaxID=217475 RepID=UPI0025AD4F60|nr:putative disease resistance protein RGA3 isoform X2 [Arachis stenosperma]
MYPLLANAASTLPIEKFSSCIILPTKLLARPSKITFHVKRFKVQITEFVHISNVTCYASLLKRVYIVMGQDLLQGYEYSLYRLDTESHIAGRLQHMPERVVRPRQFKIPVVPDERVRPLLRRAGFEHVAFMPPFDYDSSLVSAWIERWRPESHTFHLPLGECSVTLKDISFQLGLRINGDPVAFLGNWKQDYSRDIIPQICHDLLGITPSFNDIQGQSINMSWFQQHVCRPLGETPSHVRLEQYTRGYIMMVIGGFLFPDQSSDVRVSVKWLPLLQDLDACGRLSWGSAVLAFMYRMLCHSTKFDQSNIGGCGALLLSWIYHHVPMCRPNGYDQRRIFPLAKRWAGYKVKNDGEGLKLRYWRQVFEWTPYNDVHIQHLIPQEIYHDALSWSSVCPLLCFSIVEWHQVDRVIRHLGGLQYIPRCPLNIDEMHSSDERFGKGDEWFPSYLKDFLYEYWTKREHNRVFVFYHNDHRPSAKYLQWYQAWAHTTLKEQGGQPDIAQDDIPLDLPLLMPYPPEIQQPKDDVLPLVYPSLGHKGPKGGGSQHVTSGTRHGLQDTEGRCRDTRGSGATTSRYTRDQVVSSSCVPESQPTPRADQGGPSYYIPEMDRASSSYNAPQMGQSGSSNYRIIMAGEDFILPSNPTGSMMVEVVGDTITTLMERMNSLGVFGKKITDVKDSIIRHLSPIKMVAEPSDGPTLPLTPNWLNDVIDALTDLWDLLDDHGIPADATPLPKRGNVCFSSCHLASCGLLHNLQKIEKRLQPIVVYVTKMLIDKRSTFIKTVVEEGERKIVGRDNEQEEIINRILSLTTVEGVVLVIRIVGMKGTGKTALAELVCRDVRVTTKFSVIWIGGIHDNSYVESVKKEMLRGKGKKKIEDLNPEEATRRSRFLLVLDDLRSENHEELLSLQRELRKVPGSSGGAILVTTQNSLGPRKLVQNTWTLDILREEYCWALFEKVIGGGSSESKTSDAQKKLIKKCWGVPAAITKLATMLKTHEAISEADIKNLERKFMQEMKTMYYDELPSWHLKQCFAYLPFIFPNKTRQVVKVETLVQLWMAEGFLGPFNSSSQPKQLGVSIIKEFCRTSILSVREDEFGSITHCWMYNPLLFDLSRFVAGEGRFYMDDRGENVMQTVRRVLLTQDFDFSNGIPESLNKIKKHLRTILFPLPGNNNWSSRIPHDVTLSLSACDAIFRAFQSLHVLGLADLGMRMLPSSIGELKLLRYLNLSHNNMEKLPASIGKLKRLQSLKLSHCHQLKNLPDEVQHLVNLKHLELEGCLDLAHMPSTLGKLTKLEKLSHFTVSNNNCKHKQLQGFAELINLKNLRGKLEILHLERFKFEEPRHVGGAYLKDKEHLEDISLKWSHDDDNNKKDNDPKSLLDHLEPHPNLRGLSITGYRGTAFSTWLSSLKNLVSFTLNNCSMCTSLPALNGFPNLKVLRLERLDSLEYITDGTKGSTELGLGMLEYLSISDCPDLTSWWRPSETAHNNAILFSSLSILDVKYCPKLSSMPLYPNLDMRLILEGSSMRTLLDTINYRSTSNPAPPLSRVLWLKINNVEEESYLPNNWLENFVSLQYLWISEKMSVVKSFRHLPSLNTMIITNCTGVDLPSEEWGGLKMLRHLTIQEVAKLKSLPSGIKHLTSLAALWIIGCPELKTLTEEIGNLKSLNILHIENCHKLDSLPKTMIQLKSLNRLVIRSCPLLLPRCQEGTGDDWPQIKHIKDIYVAGTSEVFE